MKNYYFQIAFLQSDNDTEELNELLENEEYSKILDTAEDYDFGDDLDLEHTFDSPTPFIHDDLIIEGDYAVTRNFACDYWSIFRKVTEEDVRTEIRENGIPRNATDEIKEFAKSLDPYRF